MIVLMLVPLWLLLLVAVACLCRAARAGDEALTAGLAAGPAAQLHPADSLARERRTASCGAKALPGNCVARTS